MPELTECWERTSARTPSGCSTLLERVTGEDIHDHPNNNNSNRTHLGSNDGKSRTGDEDGEVAVKKMTVMDEADDDDGDDAVDRKEEMQLPC